MSSENGHSPRKKQSTGVLRQAVSKVTENNEFIYETPSELLASLLNIKGSVQLEDYLAGYREPYHIEGPATPVEAIRAKLAVGIEEIRRRLDQDFATAYRPRFRLPNAHRAWSTLERTGYWKAHSKGDKKALQKIFRSTVRTVWAPFAEFIEVRVKRSLFALAELRAQLGEDVRTLSETAHRLEALDTVMREAVKPEVDALYKRVYAANERRFGLLFKQAMDELPDVADREGFLLGFSESGWLGDTFSEAMGLAAAICEHEITQLTRFIDAAAATVIDANVDQS